MYKQLEYSKDLGNIVVEVVVVLDPSYEWVEEQEKILTSTNYNMNSKGVMKFIYPVYTGSVEDVPDYSECGFQHVVQPYYIGNREDGTAVVEKLMELFFIGLSEVAND